MVVARARVPLGRRAVGVPQRANLLRRGQQRQRLDQLRDARVREAVVTVTAVALDRDEARAGEPREVRARRRGGDAGDLGELARRKRPAAEHRGEHPPARRVADHRGDGRDVRVAVHGHARIVAPRRFAISRTVARLASCGNERRHDPRRPRRRRAPTASPSPPRSSRWPCGRRRSWASATPGRRSAPDRCRSADCSSAAPCSARSSYRAARRGCRAPTCRGCCSSGCSGSPRTT